MDWDAVEKSLLHRALKNQSVMATCAAALPGYKFTDKNVEWVWEYCREVFDNVGEAPNTLVIRNHIEKQPPAKQVELIEAFVDILRAPPDGSPRATLKALQERAAETSTLEAMERAAEHFDRGDGKAAVAAIEKVMLSKAAKPGFAPKPLIPRKYRPVRTEERIPTGLYRLDNIIGGIQKQESGLIMGATGVGKSALSMSFLHSGLKYGRKCLLFDTENGEHVTRSRFISRLTGIPYSLIERNLLDRALKRRLDEWSERNWDRLSQNLRVVYLGYMQATLADVEAALRSEVTAGFQPDLVVFDSPDHLEMKGHGTRDAARWEQFTDLYNRIAGMWQRYNVAGWSVTQASGENIENKIATTAHTSDAKGKARVASIVASINADIDPKTKKPKPNGERVLYLAKNRNGEARFLIPLVTNFDKMRIEAPPLERGAA